MLSRRRVLKLASVASAVSLSSLAWASKYPQRPIRMVCPFPPGGAVDILARGLAAQLSVELGQTVVVDNKAGAGGMVGSAEVARAPADGYTLLFNSSSLVQAPAVAPQKLYDPLRDFTPIGSIGRTGMPIVVPASSPVNNLEEFVAWAKGKKAAYGTYGPGTTPHAFLQLLSDHHKLDMVHTAYRGEAAMLNDLLGGQIPVAMGTLNTLAPQIKAGKLKALVMLSPERVADLPDVPTFTDLKYPSDFEWKGGFIALLAPAKLPADITQTLADAFKRIMDKPDIKPILNNAYVVGKPTTLSDTAVEIRTTNEAWTKLVTKLNLQQTN